MRQKNHPLLFEMLRSFTTLAETLNLSRAVQKLDSTRQTVRRHISILEEIKGDALFEISDRQYYLTAAGRRCLRGAIDLQARGEAWVNNEISHIEGLQRLHRAGENGWEFFLQQQPLSAIWDDSSDLLSRGIHSWTLSRGDITHEALDDIRENLMVFRRASEGWICTSVGSKSSYATWYGRQWEYSSIGRALPSMPGGTAHAEQIAQPFEQVRANRGLRYDHIHTYMTRADDEPMEPISFKRLLLGCHFPDKSFALVSLVERSYALHIQGCPQERIESMPAKWVMDGSDCVAADAKKSS